MRKRNKFKAKRSNKKPHLEGDAQSHPQVTRRKDIRRWMTPLWILSGLVLTLAGLLYALLPHYRFHALWMAFVGTVFGVAALFVWLHATMAEHNTSHHPEELDKSPHLPLSTSTPMKDQQPSKSISTVNQSGGQNIVADIVNLASEKRSFTPDNDARFAAALSTVSKGSVVVEYLLGDGEAGGFAEQIAERLRSSGFTVRSVNAVILKGDPGTGMRILVNPQEKTADSAFLRADAIRAGFEAMGLEVEIRHNPDIPLGNITIRVAPL